MNSTRCLIGCAAFAALISLVFAWGSSFVADGSAGLVHEPYGAILSEPSLVAAGVDDGWWSDVASDLERNEYTASANGRGLQAPNRAQNLRTYFREGGIDVAPRQREEGAAAWQFTWRTSRWGRTGRLASVRGDAGEPRIDGPRVTYAHAGLDEWYENKKEGLEQGFTVRERPSGDSPLVLVGHVGGGLLPALRHDAGAIDFIDEHGACVLRYGALHVWDAFGEEIPSHLALEGTDIALVIDDAGATYPLTIDPLMTSPSWTAEGDQVSAGFGLSVATAGDVNGDGFSDVIVGAYLFDNGQTDEGRAFVYLGSPSGLNAAPNWTAESNQSDAQLGYSVATAGDVNGDGFDDVIVGAFAFDNGQTDEGRAMVYFGSAGGLSPAPSWTAESNQANSWFGLSVATAGDVNGDGFDEVIVGALLYDNGQTDEGRAFLYHGSSGGPSAAPNWTAEGNQAGAWFGISVATAGDVNGNGFADVIVGAERFTNDHGDEGRAFVYHGSAGGLSAVASWTAEGNQAACRFGFSVATAGDVNGDGFCDAIVGALAFDATGDNQGRAFVYFGSGIGLSASPSWTAGGDQTDVFFGYSVATAGDVNGDGFADLIVGARSYDNGQVDEGRVFVFHGSASGPGGSADWSVDGNQASAYFGGCVATAGDVNGDGYGDVIVGAFEYDNGEGDEGRAFVYHGSAGSPAVLPGWIAEGDQDFASLGNSVATAGDVNGDGFSDVIVGAPNYDNGQDNEGRAMVFHGSAAGLGTTAAWIAESDQVQAQFGSSVATAGDVNGDGFSDIVVGAPRFDNVLIEEGRVFVYHGSAAGLSGSPNWTAESDQGGAFFASSVGTAGDVNGDGYGDVIVGAPGFANGQASEGRAFVYHGSATGLANAPAWTAESNQAGAGFARAVATAGDVNGDGFSDVVIGAPFYDDEQIEEGRAFAFHGSSTGLSSFVAWAAEGNGSGEQYGRAVGTAGDVNGDGYSDVIVGAPASGGRAYVYLGSFAGIVSFPAWTAEATDPGSNFGGVVGSAGDVNGDGYSDVIVAAWTQDGIQLSEGAAFVYGGSPTPSSMSSIWSGTGGQSHAGYGAAAGSAGDVNGDGYSDIIVGARDHDNGHSDEGRASIYYGNGSKGLDRVPRQFTTDDSETIQHLGRSDSQSAFRLRALGRTAAGRGKVRMQYEVEPFGTPFDGAGAIIGPSVDTGIPVFGRGSAVALSGIATDLTPETLYHWRLRALSDSPFFPRSPWFTLPGNAVTEADIRTAPATTAVAGGPSPVHATWLEPCAPNPFTTSTRLAYTLPERGPARLAIYDASGRTALVLADGIQDAGRHTRAWDGRGGEGRELPSGVYFARLEFDGRVEARKIVRAR